MYTWHRDNITSRMHRSQTQYLRLGSSRRGIGRARHVSSGYSSSVASNSNDRSVAPGSVQSFPRAGTPTERRVCSVLAANRDVEATAWTRGSKRRVAPRAHGASRPRRSARTNRPHAPLPAPSRLAARDMARPSAQAGDQSLRSRPAGAMPNGNRSQGRAHSTLRTHLPHMKRRHKSQPPMSATDLASLHRWHEMRACGSALWHVAPHV
jgi:hypothetical protein